MKKRHRDTKNIGKRRKRAERACHRKRQKSNLNAGFNPALFLSRQKTLFNTLNKSVLAGLTAFPAWCAHMAVMVCDVRQKAIQLILRSQAHLPPQRGQVTDPDIRRDTTLDAFDTYSSMVFSTVIRRCRSVLSNIAGRHIAVR